ncbi:MAG: methyltransferase domain-containing protein [Pseudomonadota bacterium]
MQQAVYEFVEVCAQTLPFKGPLFEFGAFQAGEKPIDDLRPLFPNIEYVGCDMREGKGVDRILNLHALDLPDQSVSSALCIDTLEHVEYPRKAVEEIRRVLDVDGFAVFSSVFEFPIHGYPDDYWRFTPNGLRSLLQNFAIAVVGAIGRSPLSPQVVVGVGFKTEDFYLDEFKKRLDKWERRNNKIIEVMTSS